MNCLGIENVAAKTQRACHVIGFGNLFRQDDGLGPWIVGQLDLLMPPSDSLHLMSGLQVDSNLVDELRKADRVVFIDASIRRLEGGWQWEPVKAQETPPTFLHSLKPGFLLWLLDQVYDHRPEAWLISIQGESFGLGQGLTPLAEKRADEVISALTGFFCLGGEPWPPNRIS